MTANDKAAFLKLLPTLSKITGRFCYMDRLTVRNCDTEQQNKFSGHVCNRSANTRARKPSLPRGTRPLRAFVCSSRLSIPEQKERPPPVYSLRSNVFCFSPSRRLRSCRLLFILLRSWLGQGEGKPNIHKRLRGVSRSYQSQYRG